MKYSFKILITCIFLLLAILSDCKKEDNNDSSLVKTNLVENVRRTWARVIGSATISPTDTIIAVGFCWNIKGAPTLYDKFTFEGTWTEEFSSYIQGLAPNTTYYVRAYASCLKGVYYGNEIKFSTMEVSPGILFNSDLTYGTVSDNDGNIYKTIDIGTQTWMAENLKVTNYNDNTKIPLITDNDDWESLSTPGYCWYENNEEIYKNLYGAYYNGYAVLTGKLCPTGWHIPSNEEWQTLEFYLGVQPDSRGTVEGLKIKETGSHNWYPVENIDGTNETGFTGLPGGFRMGYDGGNIGSEGYIAFWWTSSGYPQYNWLYTRNLLYIHSDINQDSRELDTGMNVRCIKD